MSRIQRQMDFMVTSDFVNAFNKFIFSSKDSILATKMCIKVDATFTFIICCKLSLCIN